MKDRDFINEFFFGKPNPTEAEKLEYKEKMAAYMKAHGFDPDKAEWSNPAAALIEQDRIQRSN